MPKIKPARDLCIGFPEKKIITHKLDNTCAAKYNALDATEILPMPIQVICTSGNPPQKSTTLRFYYPPLPVGKR